MTTIKLNSNHRTGCPCFDCPRKINRAVIKEGDRVFCRDRFGNFYIGLIVRKCVTDCIVFIEKLVRGGVPHFAYEPEESDKDQVFKLIGVPLADHEGSHMSQPDLDSDSDGYEWILHKLEK